MVGDNYHFPFRLPVKKRDGNVYQRNKKPFFQLDNQEDFAEKDSKYKPSSGFSWLASCYDSYGLGEKGCVILGKLLHLSESGSSPAE